TTPKTFSEYLSTSVHEHLHYTSFQPERDLWPVFMEEGMTELLAVNAVSKYIDNQENLGLLAYGNQVKLLLDIFSKSDQTKLVDLYFNDKSEEQLSELLTSSFSEFDYNDFRLKGESLLYVGFEDLSERQELKEEMDEMIR